MCYAKLAVRWRVRVAIAVTWILLSVPSVSEAQDRWAIADSATVRRPPSSFRGLPRRIRAELERRGCTIPQVPGLPVSNVIRGSFTRPGRLDWAVLCSAQRRSAILVFVAGRADSIVELSPADDRHFLQTGPGGAIEYSRRLSRASPDYMRRQAQAFGGELPSPVNHSGIEDAFVGKASVVWYCHGGRWIQLTGMD